MKPACLLLLFLFSCVTFVKAQNKILLLDGRVKEAKQYELKGDDVFYKRSDAEDKSRKFFLWKTIWPDNKLRKLYKYDVFSVTKADGAEEVFYDPDPVDGDPGVPQVRNYIKGEQYGMAVYHKPWNKVGGGIAGFASSIAGYYGPAGVFLYAMVVSRFNPQTIPPTTLIEPEVFNSEEFKTGYTKYARNKKIKDSLIFGGIGFAVGFPIFYLAFK